MLWLPGIAMAYAWRLRGITAWGAAPALTVGVTSGTAVLAGLVGIDWSLVPVIVVAVVAATVGMVATGTWRGAVARLRRGAGRRSLRVTRVPRAAGLWCACFAAVAVVLGVSALRLVRLMGAADAVAQGNDIPYHLNAVKLILTSGSASSLDMTLATPERAHNFYPAAWHGLVALIVQLTGCGIDVATNVLAVTVAVAVWPAAMMALTRGVFGPRPEIVAATGILSLSFTQFPGHLLTWGILYPNLLSYALVPAAMALVLRTARRRSGRLIAACAVAALAAVGVVLAQPNGLFGASVLLLAWFEWRILAAARRRLRRGRPGLAVSRATVSNAAIALGIAALLASPAIAAMRTNPGYISDSPWQRALGCVASLGAPHTFPAANWPMVLLVALGALCAIWVVRARWLVASLGAVAVLYVVMRGPDSEFRDLLTAPWYHDPARITALIPIVALPLAALGLVAVVRLLARAAGARRVSGSLTYPVAASVIVLAAGGAWLAAHSSASHQLAGDIAIVYSQSGERPDAYPTGKDALEQGRGWCGDNPTTLLGGLFDRGERSFIDEVAEIVPQDEAIVSDPRDGSSLVWALGGVRTLTPALNMELSPDLALVVGRLDQAETLPGVCAAVNRLDLHYVLDWGEGIWDRRSFGYEGIASLSKSDTVELLARRGHAKLYRIVACDAGDMTASASG
ncbi:DUF6541 family protein [Rarobacter faecitabidus]|uniref:DUF6541 family protein n=1 Tax=Rarobacter faecitabidus TaxID=13243 RepID=UPI003CCC664B